VSEKSGGKFVYLMIDEILLLFQQLKLSENESTDFVRMLCNDQDAVEWKYALVFTSLQLGEFDRVKTATGRCYYHIELPYLSSENCNLYFSRILKNEYPSSVLTNLCGGHPRLLAILGRAVEESKVLLDSVNDAVDTTRRRYLDNRDVVGFDSEILTLVLYGRELKLEDSVVLRSNVSMTIDELIARGRLCNNIIEDVFIIPTLPQIMVLAYARRIPKGDNMCLELNALLETMIFWDRGQLWEAVMVRFERLIRIVRRNMMEKHLPRPVGDIDWKCATFLDAYPGSYNSLSIEMQNLRFDFTREFSSETKSVLDLPQGISLDIQHFNLYTFIESNQRGMDRAFFIAFNNVDKSSGLASFLPSDLDTSGRVLAVGIEDKWSKITSPLVLKTADVLKKYALAWGVMKEAGYDESDFIYIIIARREVIFDVNAAKGKNIIIVCREDCPKMFGSTLNSWFDSLEAISESIKFDQKQINRLRGMWDMLHSRKSYNGNVLEKIMKMKKILLRHQISDMAGLLKLDSDSRQVLMENMSKKNARKLSKSFSDIDADTYETSNLS